MLSSFVWLNPSIAPAVLKTASNLLQGVVPSPAAKLASALKSAEDAQCEGALRDRALREGLAAGLQKAGEISASSCADVVEAFATAFEARVKDCRDKASKLEKSLPKKPMPTFGEFAAALPKGHEPSQALKSDWMLWHAMGNGYDAKALPALTEKVMRDRAAQAACAGEGLGAEFILSLQILENLDAYVAWEMTVPASKAPKKSIEVLEPFSDKQAKEVATRRVLLHAGLPVDVASKAAAKAVMGIGLAQALKELAAEAKKAAVLPLYIAPAAPKEPKGKSEAKDKGEGKDEVGKKQGGAKPVANGAVTTASGPVGSLHAATATQELQWALLSYQLRPRTSLSAAPPAAQGCGVVAGDAASTRGPKLAGFAGVWGGDVLPPGHTPYSWNHATVLGMKKGFGNTWEAVGEELPPGHTPCSWENVRAATGGSPATSSTTAPAAKAPLRRSLAFDKDAEDAAKQAAAAPAAPAKAAPAKAAPAAASAGGAEPPEGSEESALTKLDIRCGRIKECSRVPDADSLYLLKIDVGEPEPRQVVSSLVKHYKEDQLKYRQVLVYCNIKPGKMRGFESQAMVLAATNNKGADNEQCELLAPPKGVKEGSRVLCGNLEAGSASDGVSTKNISKVWGTVQPLLQMNSGKEATFKGTTLTFPGGAVTASSLTGCGIY